MTTNAKRPWLVFALVTTIFWGIWGAFIEIPEKAGFPATLGYIVWALVMIPCAVVALWLNKWQHQTRGKDVLFGLAVGLTGAGGQLLLFQALREGPAYLLFPIISLFPVVTILLSVGILKERASKSGRIGILFSLVAIVLLSFQPPSAGLYTGYLWLLLAIIVLLLWGIQGFLMKLANNTMDAESVFFYMALAALLLTPVAWYMTNFSQPINLGWKGPGLAAIIHLLNAIGALTLVYAMRYGKAIIVVPLTGLSPVITILLSLLLYQVIPHPVILVGLIFASIAIYLITE